MICHINADILRDRAGHDNAVFINDMDFVYIE